MNRKILVIFIAPIFLFYSKGVFPQEEEEAKLHFKQGVALFQEGDYKKALGEFLRSYELKPNWRLKLNIGICYYNIRKFVDAKKNLEEYLAKGKDTLSEEKKQKARDLLEKIKNVTAELKVDVNVKGASVYLDEKKIAETPMKFVTIETGYYTVRVEADGYEVFERDINVAGGDRVVLPVELKKKGRGKPIEKVAKQQSAREEVVEEPITEEKKEEETGKKEEKISVKKKGRAKGLLIGTVVASVFAAGGWASTTAMGLIVLQKKSDFDDCQKSPQGLTDKCIDLKDEGNKYKKIVNFGLIPASAILTATAVALGVITGIKKKTIKAEEKGYLGSVRIGILNAGAVPFLSISGQF